MAEGDIHLYGTALPRLLTSTDDLDADTVKLALLTGHTANFDTHDFFDDVSVDEFVHASYTAGGNTMSTITVTYTADGSATAHATSTAYSVGDIVRPSAANGYVYRCVVAGTSGGSAPTFSTVLGVDTTDGTVTWSTFGTGFVTLDAANVTFSSLDGGTPNYAVMYKDTGTASTSPLYLAMELATAANGGDYTVSWNANGIYVWGISN